MQGFEHVKTLLGKTLTCDFFEIFVYFITVILCKFHVFFVHFGIIKDFNRLFMVAQSDTTVGFRVRNQD
jgi:hypothetical protein